MRLALLLAFMALVGTSAKAAAHEVTIDSASARATMEALGNPALTREEALRIARMPASLMAVRKMKGQSPEASEERFAEELVTVATGGSLRGPSLFRFERAKRARADIVKTLDAIDRDKAGFTRWVKDRVSAFSPPGSSLSLEGHLVAAGGPTGFAFGGNDFYLNITHFPDDLDGAKAVTAHELYHAVQGAAVKALGSKAPARFSDEKLAALSGTAREAYLVDKYLGNLLTEGIAMYVGDPELLKNSKGSYSTWDLNRLRQQQGRMDRWVIMLDMALIALTAEKPIAYKDAYALGFYGDDQPLYFLGYEMAKAIAAAKGPARLGELITGTGCGFAREYLAVSQNDQKAPKLADRTRGMITQHCTA